MDQQQQLAVVAAAYAAMSQRVILLNAALTHEYVEQQNREAARGGRSYRPEATVRRGAIAEHVLTLQRPDNTCLNVTRLHWESFEALTKLLVEKHGLRGGRVPAAGRLMIFLDMSANRISLRRLAVIYESCIHTLSHIMRLVLKALLSLQAVNIGFNYHPALAFLDPKFQHFRDAVGAVDGVLIPLSMVGDASRYRSRKGLISHNVMGVVNFDGTFAHIVAGVEGASHDTRVFDFARKDGMVIPRWKYLLADQGYSANDISLLVPYPNTRYHLREQAAANMRPANKEELFNLRHSQLRNIVERVFGVMKGRWEVLRHGTKYLYKKSLQVNMVRALGAVHNFLIQQGYEDIPEDDDDDRNPLADASTDEESLDDSALDPSQPSQAKLRRDQLAVAMWVDYEVTRRYRR